MIFARDESRTLFLAFVTPSLQTQVNRMSHITSVRSIKQITAAVLSIAVFYPSLVEAATVSQSIKTSIQQRVDYAYNPGIVIGIVDRDGRDFYSYGTTSIIDSTLPDENTLYELGSVSKVLTATLLAEMVESGEVKFDDPVASLLPQEVNVPSHLQINITLKHLATHTSGLPSITPAMEESNAANPLIPFPVTALYDFLNSYTLTRSPGDTFGYSNLGMGLLGHALGRQLATPYEKALQERLLLPMGMKDTVVTPSTELNARRAQGYNGIVTRPEFKVDLFEAAGSWLSTANDMLTFLEHQLGVRNSTLSSVIEDTQRSHFSRGSPDRDFGLGWFIDKIGQETIHSHVGITFGHNSFAGINIEAKKGAIVMTNARVNQYAYVRDLGLHFLAPESSLRPLRRPVSLTDHERTRLKGRYLEISEDLEESEELEELTIGQEHSHLTVTSSLGPDAGFTLYPSSSLGFQFYEASNISASVVFSLGPDDQAISLQWTQDDESAIYIKLPPPDLLTLTKSQDGPTLNVNGDEMTTYNIESSRDLHHWTPYQSLRGDSSFLIPTDQLIAPQYFRIR
jgi:serine-type D-Ala-D-Ala carboxypeptidase/endopeptidase